MQPLRHNAATQVSLSLQVDWKVLELLTEEAEFQQQTISEAAESILWDHLNAACVSCRTFCLEMWMAPDDVWRYYIPEAWREKILCRECWEDIVRIRDGGRYERRHGSAAG